MNEEICRMLVKECVQHFQPTSEDHVEGLGIDKEDNVIPPFNTNREDLDQLFKKGTEPGTFVTLLCLLEP